MVLQPPQSKNPKSSLFSALRYSDQFDYPLSMKEIWFWQPFTNFSLKHLSLVLNKKSCNEFLYLPGRSGLVKLRKFRNQTSQHKWKILETAALRLKWLPTIRGIFVTGSLSMNNCRPLDDIDLMIITSRDAVWVTRLLVALYLKAIGLRRPPKVSAGSSPEVADKLCDNLYLDIDHLYIPHTPDKSMYLAHEILQAVPVWQRTGVYQTFLKVNSWAKKYLPVAYKQKMLQSKQTSQTSQLHGLSFMPVINYCAFIFQYLYMRENLFLEKIGLGYAFFHPKRRNFR